MALDRGRLARIDRRLYAEVDDSVGSQMVRVRISDAAWSSWRRYCELLGLSMGEAIAELIGAELTSVVDAEGRTVAEIVEEILQETEDRWSSLDARQRKLDAQADALNRKERALMEWEQTLRAMARASVPNAAATTRRNEPCPCGSGVKYKRCHGQPK